MDNNVTLSALPHIVHKIKKKLQNPDLELPPVKSFQAHATEQVTERWKELTEFKPESPKITLLAAPLDPRYGKLKFLPADEALSVKSIVQTMAALASGNGASSTSEDSPPAARGGKMTTSFLDWNSITLYEEQDKEQLSNEAVQKEVSTNNVLFWFSLMFCLIRQYT